MIGSVVNFFFCILRDTVVPGFALARELNNFSSHSAFNILLIINYMAITVTMLQTEALYYLIINMLVTFLALLLETNNYQVVLKIGKGNK